MSEREHDGQTSDWCSSQDSTVAPRKPIHPLLLLVHADMHGAWRKDDQLLAKFFPIDPKFAAAYRNTRKELYNERADVKRWQRIPPKPTSLSVLYTPLTHLFNRILFHHEISKFKRLFLNTHIRSLKSQEIEPGILLAGVGSEFGNSIATLPRAYYHSSICPFEIILESYSMNKARHRLAVHMHRIWQEQENRRFAFGLVFTQNTFTVYMFDHAGAVASEPCNYHANPEQLCAVIAGLAGQGVDIGFDISMASESGLSILNTTETRDGVSDVTTRYHIVMQLFQSSSLVGRGTFCWLATLLDDAKEYFVIKDAWVPEGSLEGRESEGSLLRHAQDKGIAVGVAQIRHIENIRRSANPSDLDTVLQNRQATPPSSPERNFNRIHTRIVMKTYGKTLDKFSTRKELILAFHDAVLAHRNLHQVAGILHRDVSVRNILINSDGVEGDRGILIDFDHAIRVGDTSPYSTKRKIGTWRYMSRDVHGGHKPHTYLDDLESFYYVLVWILVAYRGPGVGVSKLPNVVVLWNDPCAAMLKQGLMMSDFDLPVSPWFGSSFHDLAVRLFTFFTSRSHLLGDRRPEPDPVKDYDEFLGHIRQCILEMDAEDLVLASGRENGIQEQELVIESDANSSDNDNSTPPVQVPPPKKRHTGPQIMKVYPKRSTANYGVVV